jgi:hypothetical protein
MKSFLRNLALYIVLVGSVVVSLSLLSDFAVKQREFHILKISKDINTVFAGDSNIECAINDSLIANSINIAQSGEAYMYTYVKLKSLLDYNDQIRSVFIGFSPLNLVKYTEERWLFNDEFIIEKITSYNYLMHVPDKTLIFRHKPVSYARGFMKSIFTNFKVFIKSFSSREFNSKIINFGGYEYVTRDKLQEDIKMNTFNKETFGEGLIQIQYLEKISLLCQQKSINLILLNTPKHTYLNTNINNRIIQNWHSVRNSLTRDSLLDLSALSYPDSCFGDLTHLNYKGARLFSKYMNEKLMLKTE